MLLSIFFSWLGSSPRQMLAQSTDAQAAEKAVITTFNSKLAAKISSFKANNTGVWLYSLCNSSNVLIMLLFLWQGYYFPVGLQCSIHSDFELSHDLRVCGCYVLWFRSDHVLGVCYFLLRLARRFMNTFFPFRNNYHPSSKPPIYAQGNLIVNVPFSIRQQILWSRNRPNCIGEHNLVEFCISSCSTNVGINTSRLLLFTSWASEDVNSNQSATAELIIFQLSTTIYTVQPSLLLFRLNHSQPQISPIFHIKVLLNASASSSIPPLFIC